MITTDQQLLLAILHNQVALAKLFGIDTHYLKHETIKQIEENTRDIIDKVRNAK